MQIAGRQEERLSGVQGDPVEQHRGQHPRVPRVALAELEHGPVLGKVGPCALAQPATQAASTASSSGPNTLPGTVIKDENRARVPSASGCPDSSAR